MHRSVRRKLEAVRICSNEPHLSYTELPALSQIHPKLQVQAALPMSRARLAPSPLSRMGHIRMGHIRLGLIHLGLIRLGRIRLGLIHLGRIRVGLGRICL